MKKLRLELDDLQVESFRTDEMGSPTQGTVQGRNWVVSLLAGPIGCAVTDLASCTGCDTAANTCPDSCQWSCGASCGPACETRYIGTCTSPAAPCYGETLVDLSRCHNQVLQPD